MEPITREEKYLSAIVKGEQIDTKPITRKEQYLYAIANKTDVNVEPVTRQDALLSAWSAKKSGILLQDKTITENGTYTADDGYDGLGSVTVEVDGAGGGSLPAGGYWKQEKSMKPSVYSGWFFEYNEKRYWYGLSAYNDKNFDIYLLENDVYTLVATDVISSDYGMDYGCAVELNGKLHLLVGNDYHTYHYVWEGGTSVTVSTKAPYPIGCQHAFVIDGDMYIKTKKNGFYKWVEADSSWEVVEVTNCPDTSYEGTVVIDRKVYIVGYNKIHEVDWDAKVCTTIATDIPNSTAGHGCAVAFQGNIYLTICGYSNVYHGVYKYNLKNKTYEVVAGINGDVNLYVYENRIYASKNKGILHQALYEVTE